MTDRTLSIADIMLIAGTRVALGIGIGLLLSSRFSRDTRKGAGLALFAVGALSSIPLGIKVARSGPSLVERHAA